MPTVTWKSDRRNRRDSGRRADAASANGSQRGLIASKGILKRGSATRL